MDLKHTLNTELGEYEIYINASDTDLDYLQRLALMYLVENDIFPFQLLSPNDLYKFHNTPEIIQ